MDAAEFLRARIAEDQRQARRAFLDWMQRTFGLLTMDDDPEWVESMVQSFLADPDFLGSDAREVAEAYDQ